ncbi:hypothetical protein [Acetivibrio cellulolyticus]|uniref:hypothetical protein n=1 Tax=Acetivibrio cellulolyticus TaxID=35830 RepID=UPI0001E2F60E|nr:hypothetical protein [Acetivibrio cellulolyticus]
MSVKFPAISNSQFALVFCESDTGIVLYKDLQRFIGQGDYYYVFDSLKEAENFALEITNENPNIDGVIYNHENSRVKTISNESYIPQIRK